MANTNPIYNEKLSCFNSVLNSTTGSEKPVRVPVYTIADAWVARQAGIDFRDAYVNDMPRMKDALKWLNENVYTDVHWSAGFSHPFPVINLFSGGLYKFDSEGFQITGGESEVMREDEYEQFITDNINFKMNVLLPRKYKELQSMSKEEAADLLANAIKVFLGWSSQNAEVVKYSEEELGLPLLCKGVALNPMDYILDALRDFRGAFKDLRRQPENVLRAIDVIYPQMIQMPLGMGIQPNDEGSVVFIPMHIATFLNPKQFETFYFPSMKKQTVQFNEMGFRVLYFCEDDWTPFMDILQDLPAGNNAFSFEKGDAKYIKSRICEKGTYIGGMPTELLKLGTKEECLDQAKRCLDDLAPGGKYIFSTTKTATNKNDATVENYAAVCEYIHENGKY